MRVIGMAEKYVKKNKIASVTPNIVITRHI